MSTAIASQTKQANALDTIDSMLQSIGETKTADSNTEAGGYQGETEHPVKKEDDGTEDAYEGSRASENEADVKEEQSPNEVVGETAVDKESAEKAALGLGESVNQDDVQLNIGTNQKATGEDDANETGKAKGGKDDSADGTPGSQGRGKSTHPARTNNDEIDGHKWSQALGVLGTQIKTAADLGTAAIAAISVDADTAVKEKVASMNAGVKKAAEDCDACKSDPCTCKSAAEKAGADAVTAIAEGAVPSSDKEAQDQQVVADIAATIIHSYKVADVTAQFLEGLSAGAAEKLAMEGEEEEREGDPGSNPPGAEEESGAPPEEMGGGYPEEGGDDPMVEMGGDMGGGMGDPMGGPPGGGGGEEEALLQALTAGGGEGGEMGGGMMGGGAPPMGGEDPMAAMGGGGAPPMGGGMDGGMGGGDPMAAMGGGGAPPMGGPPMGGDPMGGDPMGEGMGGAPGGIGEEQLMMLAAALDEAGITPEQLEMAATAKTAHSLKQAATAVRGQASKWRPKTAGQANRYQNIINHVREVCSTGS